MSDIVFDGMIFDRLREIGDQGDRIASLEAENERLRLTDAEREALETAARMTGDPSPITAPQVFEYAATLRDLLERLK